MLINLKLIHYLYYKYDKIEILNIFLPLFRKIKKFITYLGFLLFYAKEIIKPSLYKNNYELEFKINTKYLFLLTIYIIYSKLNNIINHFFFKFNVNVKKQKKYTILRAPCNHKNSKEQFGLNIYHGKLKGTFFNCNINNFYHYFILSLFFQEKLLGGTAAFYVTHLKKKNVS